MVAAGWYPDPQDPNVHRYYDGQNWTEHRRPVAGPPVAPPPVAPQAPPTWTGQAPPTWTGQAPPTWTGQAQQPWSPAAAPAWQQPPPTTGYPTPYPPSTPPPYPGAGRHRRKRPLIIGLVAVLIASLLTGGYFLFLRGDNAPKLTYKGAKIKDASGVLKAAETNLAVIVGRRHGAKSADTRCYYAVPKKQASGAKKTDIDSNLRCGPVLFVDGDTAKQYLSFALTTPGSGGTVTLTAATAPQSADPVALPAELKLQRPDDKHAPSGTGQLAVPKPPAAVKDMLLAADLGSSTPPAQIAGAKMISLNTGVRLTSAGIVSRYGRGDDARSAPIGEQLIAFQTTDVAGENGHRPTTDSLTVHVAGSPARRLPTAASSDTYVIVAVVSGAVATLELTDAGYTQTLSLPMGTAGPKNLAVLTRTHRVITLAKKATVPILISNGTNSAHITFRASAISAGLDFWVPGHLTSHPVRTSDAMLSVRVTYTDSSAPGQTYGFDSQLLKLRLPDGRTVSARNVAPSGKIYNVFEVPASFTRGTVLLTGKERSGGVTLTVTTTSSFSISFSAN